MRLITFKFDEHTLIFQRDSILVDTNVLVSAFLPEDQEHESAKAFIETLSQGPTPPLVPLSVATETWGLLVGARGRVDCGHKFLQWLNNPASATLIPQHCRPMPRVQKLVSDLKIDMVDATIITLATELTEKCDITPSLQVATLDTRDFLRCIVHPGVKIRLYDLRSNDEV